MTNFKSTKAKDPAEDILEKASAELAEAEKEKVYSVIVASLNVRKTPSDKEANNIDRVIPSGTKLKGISEGEWIKLEDGNYVKAEFVAPVKEG